MPSAAEKSVEAGARAIYMRTTSHALDGGGPTWEELPEHVRETYRRTADVCLTEGMMAGIEDASHRERSAVLVDSRAKSACWKAAEWLSGLSVLAHNLGLKFAEMKERRDA